MGRRQRKRQAYQDEVAKRERKRKKKKDKKAFELMEKKLELMKRELEGKCRKPKTIFPSCQGMMCGYPVGCSGMEKAYFGANFPLVNPVEFFLEMIK